jgi:hypothetical protein
MTNQAKPQVTLSVQSPDIINDQDAEFSITMPRDLVEADYRFLRERIEFRRKCMNQGFDNLLELLDKHFVHFQKAKAMRETDAPTVHPENN